MPYDAPHFMYHDISTPVILYKYRNWDLPLHRRIITEQEIYLSPPSSFEDQLDCRNPIRYDLLSEQQIFELYFYHSLDENPGFSDAEHEAFARSWHNRSALRDKIYIKQKQGEAYKAFNQRIGVLCITADPTNAEMWHKYSRSSREFAVGFRTEILMDLLGSGGPVQYQTPLPVIMPYPWDSYHNQDIKQIYFKQRHWEFEKEYRSVIFSQEPLSGQQRVIKVPIEAYEEIVFGALSTQTKREKIMSAAKVIIPHINFKLAQVDRGTREISLISL